MNPYSTTLPCPGAPNFLRLSASGADHRGMPHVVIFARDVVANVGRARCSSGGTDWQRGFLTSNAQGQNIYDLHHMISLKILGSFHMWGGFSNIFTF